MIELFVLADSAANYRQTEGKSQLDAQRWFETAMRYVLKPTEVNERPQG